MLSNKHVSLALGAGLGIVFLASLPAAWSNLNQLKQRQFVANNQLIEWKSSYEALLPVNERFVNTFPAGDDAKDLVTLYRMLDVEKHNLVADVDMIRQTSASVVEVNGMQIGLQSLCLSNDSDALSVTAKSIRELRLGLRALSERKDVDLGTVQVELKNGLAVAKIKGACLKVRTERSVDAMDTGEQL